MTSKYPNLRIYVDRNVVRYSPDKLNKNAKYNVSFHISLYNADSHIGEKIERALKDIGSRVSNFSVLPVPRCLFRSGYPKPLSEKMIDEPKKFLMDGNDFRFFFDEEVEDLKGRLELLPKCSECKFKRNGVCEGIYGVKSDEMRYKKTNQWLISDVSRHGRVNFLDLGCGYTPFLRNYLQLATQSGSVFFCVDPSDIDIRNLSRKVPGNLKSNILALIGIGEHIPLGDGAFDFVLLQYSYSHFMDIEKTIKNIHRVLKKDGILLIFEDYHPEKKLRKAEATKKPWKDIILDRVEFRNHSLKDATGILETHGFEVLDSFESRGEGRVSWGMKLKKA